MLKIMEKFGIVFQIIDDILDKVNYLFMWKNTNKIKLSKYIFKLL